MACWFQEDSQLMCYATSKCWHCTIETFQIWGQRTITTQNLALIQARQNHIGSFPNPPSMLICKGFECNEEPLIAIIITARSCDVIQLWPQTSQFSTGDCCGRQFYWLHMTLTLSWIDKLCLDFLEMTGKEKQYNILGSDIVTTYETVRSRDTDCPIIHSKISTRALSQRYL